jgi:hypothetical protein
MVIFSGQGLRLNGRTNSDDGDDHSKWDAYALQRERKFEQTLNKSHQEPFGEEGELGLIVEVI